MSKYLPLENITFRTKLSIEQTIQKLTENTEDEKSSVLGARSTKYSKPYIGKIYGNNFEIVRAISYRNSFLPQIKGEIYSDFDGTKVRVNMKPHSFVLVFMTIWIGGVFIACIATTFTLLTQAFEPILLIPYGMLIAGIALLYIAFKTESAISKKDLQRIFEAEIS